MSIPLPLIESLAMAALDHTDRHLGAGPDRRILIGDDRPQRVEDPDLRLDVDPPQDDLGDEWGVPLLEHDNRHELRDRAGAQRPLDLELLELGVDPDLAHEVLHVPDHAGAGGTRAVGNLEDLPP